MSLWVFLTAVLALLLAPGPTNTLMGVAGAQGGLARVLRLLPAELAGYLVAIVALGVVGGQVLTRWPGAEAGLTVAAALWVMALAWMLWGKTHRQMTQTEVSSAKVLVTTVLNPKALVFALVLLPKPHDMAYAGRLAVFALCVTVVALAWGSFGAAVSAGGGPRRMQWVQRTASLWLGTVSVLLLAGAMRS